jgi:uncharacterized phage protein (TIGR02218 family)
MTYKSCSGLDLLGTKQYGDVTENDVNIVGFLNSDDINEHDITDGLFDNAEIDIFLVNKDFLDGEKIYLAKGYFRDIQFVDNKFYVNIEGMLTLLKKSITENYSPLCRASFCDMRCKLNRTNYITSASVSSVNSRTSFFSNDLVNFEKNYFKYGSITFRNGKNADRVVEVKENNNGTVILGNAPDYDMEVGDNFEIIAGCDKTIETCALKFNNNINFRGEPNIPRTKIYKFY